MQPTTPISPVFFEAPSRRATMAQQTPEVDTLDQLQTPQQVELLDKIDELRNQGLGHHGISLPQLIVCGDQSSGKSSLLEGLTRLRFPTKEGLCTTFATEVVLRKETNVEISCTITPGKSRSQAERHELSKFKHIFSSRENFSFPSVLEAAKEQMAHGTKANRGPFFEDVLRVKYSGPDLPSLTIVDLPGIIETQLEGGSGAERVVDLVTSYMRDEKSIILAVVPACYDPEIQKVFKYLKEFDPKGSRTLGIITKPDMIERGGDNEKELMRLAKNEKYPLQHRWHAVRNRSFVTREQTDAERDATERKFFSDGIWSHFPSEDVGISSLRVKLSRVLLEHIGKELPSLVAAVQGAITSTQHGLKALGDARETSRQQRSYLTGHAEKFQMLTHDALRGIYSNPFFGLSSPDERTPTRLRTEIQNMNIAFTHIMYRKGHTWEIANDQSSEPFVSSAAVASFHSSQEYDAWFQDPAWISRAEFLEKHVGEYVRQSRPSGLPSLVNPWVIGEVFRQQSMGWREIAQRHLQRIFEAVKDYIEEALGSLVDPRTCSMLMLKQIQPELDRRWRSVEAKLEELLVPYTEQDPITYDPGFVREIEETRAARYRLSASQTGSTATVGARGLQHNSVTSRGSTRYLLTESIDGFTNSEILDLMQTYYKHAISVFINNIAVLAIENCLIKNLSGIFSPSLITDLSDEKLHAIAAESDEVREERDSLRQKLGALESGKDILNEHIAMRPTARTAKKVSPPRSRTSVKDTRPRTPVSQRDEDDDAKSVHLAEVEDLTAQLDNLVVTPPSSSGSKHKRPRVDSVTASPTPKGSGRKRSPYGWPPRHDVPRPTIENGSDEDD
ncbi:dynamin-1 [Cucurbitaria berberidis CBS 394.84]|uniref:Dynamin-1 n=1 Tax=Cucurbitaria berberidis CBS 394.84 TaxID=1168544 RepID=A0A9P4G7I3_9PLEO|nr:dynamin-1 [Cucurbitaria berberidis CBS 394.84]KAF1840478.1 dynamin-1 [Cucurbitaria berberidis CBS 394.84]